MTIGTEIGLIVLCVVLQGFFSGSEIAVVSCDRLLMKARADEGDAGAARVLRLLDQPTRLVGTYLIGTNLSLISGATLAALLLHRLEVLPTWSAAILYPPVTIIFAELLPKSVYHQFANTLAPIVARPLLLVSIVLTPLLFGVELFTRTALKLLGIADRQPHTVRREDIQLLLDNAVTSDIRADEKEMIQRVFSFSETQVEDAMVPLIEVTGVPDGATCDEACAMMVEQGYSRLPVYRKRIDRIIGVVTHHDLLAAPATAPVTSVMHPVAFVPESKRVDELFLELRRKRQRLAVAVDEYGGAVGIITIEDILEEIVGDIEDEFDRRRPLVRKVGEREWIASGRVERDPLRLHAGFEMPEGDYDTLAGFLLTKLGRVPAVGERLTWGDHLFTIASANERAILEVNISRARRPAPMAPS